MEVVHRANLVRCVPLCDVLVLRVSDCAVVLTGSDGFLQRSRRGRRKERGQGRGEGCGDQEERMFCCAVMVLFEKTMLENRARAHNQRISESRDRPQQTTTAVHSFVEFDRAAEQIIGRQRACERSAPIPR
jgi:hypothetical protein